MTDPNSPPRPSREQLMALGNRLGDFRKTLDAQGRDTLFGISVEDVALLSWALGIAHGYCELHGALEHHDASPSPTVPREIAEAWQVAPRRRDRPTRATADRLEKEAGS